MIQSTGILQINCIALMYAHCERPILAGINRFHVTAFNIAYLGIKEISLHFAVSTFCSNFYVNIFGIALSEH